MNLKKNILGATTVFGLFAFDPIVVQAAELQSQLTMKPLQAVSFDVESKRAVGYFLSENDTCKLVLTLAELVNWAHGPKPSFTTIRFEANVGAGEKTRFVMSESKSLEFACQTGAQIMTINGLQQIAVSPGE